MKPKLGKASVFGDPFCVVVNMIAELLLLLWSTRLFALFVLLLLLLLLLLVIDPDPAAAVAAPNRGL